MKAESKCPIDAGLIQCPDCGQVYYRAQLGRIMRCTLFDIAEFLELQGIQSRNGYHGTKLLPDRCGKRERRLDSNSEGWE